MQGDEDPADQGPDTIDGNDLADQLLAELGEEASEPEDIRDSEALQEKSPHMNATANVLPALEEPTAEHKANVETESAGQAVPKSVHQAPLRTKLQGTAVQAEERLVLGQNEAGEQASKSGVLERPEGPKGDCGPSKKNLQPRFRLRGRDSGQGQKQQPRLANDRPKPQALDKGAMHNQNASEGALPQEWETWETEKASRARKGQKIYQVFIALLIALLVDISLQHQLMHQHKI